MINKIFAGTVFAFSLVIYIATMAPTTSFWDCGEFIACSYTLGVPHPPGTPLYLLIGNVFSNLFFFINDVGARVNLISPIVSSLSVMFLYLIIVQLIKIWTKKRELINSISIYTSALIGSLLFAFTDSQWFNAVEAEVYGMSTFFTAIVVWLILRWTENRGNTGNVKYIILISYLFGLAIGVHLLNLLAIPFVVLIIYFHISDDSFSDFIIDNAITFILGIISFIGFSIIIDSSFLCLILTLAIITLTNYIRYKFFQVKVELISLTTFYSKRILVLILSTFIFGLIYIGIIKGLPNMISIFDKGLSFNGQGLSYLWDAISKFYLPLSLILFLIIGGFLSVINKYSFFKNNQTRVFISCLLMIYIGFSTYTMIPIRAIQNPNINENSPDSFENFLSYMNRDQYGEWKQVDVYNILKYYLGDDNASIDNSRILESPHIKRWAPLSANNSDISLKNEDILKFIRSYQINEMYLRYFGWQFIGKEYHKENFSWDRYMHESYYKKSNQPIQIADSLSNIDWFRYGVPFALIFGLIGLVYHFIKDPKRALSVFILFIVTGLFIILYLNQYDPQPRERDYSYVGSFFAFSIWIGIGCMAFINLIIYLFKRITKAEAKIPLIIVTSGILFGVMPLNYLINDYYYHNRSGNNAAWDYAYNILNSCKPNSILFTNGDNDTFPLWYIQEVDKIRTDVRVVNLSLLNTSWYINQIYSNNAHGTINFNFNEPIYTKKQIEAFDNPNIPFINLTPKLCYELSPDKIDCNDAYFLDLNYNNKYDAYDFEETKEIILELNDPVLGTIYAYKRWAPSIWADIEENYIKFEIQQSLDGLIAKTPFRTAKVQGETFLSLIQNDTRINHTKIQNEAKLFLVDKYSLEQNFNEVLQNLIDNNQTDLYDGLWNEYKIVQTEFYYNFIRQNAEKPLTAYLNNYIKMGKGLYGDYTSSKIWGKTPDQEGETYIIPVASFSSNIFTAEIPYKSNLINLSLEPTLQESFFKIQDIMIMKILEDIDYNRPVYFATTVNPNSRINLDLYLKNEGMVHEVTSKELISNFNSPTYLDTDQLEKNLFEIYRFTNLDNPDVYYNTDLQRILQNYRMLFMYLAEDYKSKGDYKKMKDVLLYMEKVMPEDIIKIQNPNLNLYAKELFYDAGIKDKYLDYVKKYIDANNGDIDMALSLSKKELFTLSNHIIKNIFNNRYNNDFNDFFNSLEKEISNTLINQPNQESEEIIINIILEKLKEYNINLSQDDEVMIYSLQILRNNYNNIVN